jgi:hypothetical protein
MASPDHDDVERVLHDGCVLYPDHKSAKTKAVFHVKQRLWNRTAEAVSRETTT